MVALPQPLPAPSPFAVAHREFIDAGYHVLAIEPGAKRPGSYMRGRWFPAAGWQAFAATAPDDALLTKMAGWPNAGIGVALGSRVGEHIVVALDFDTADPDELDALLAAVPASPMVKTGAKGETRFYRADPSLASKAYKIDGRGILDLLAKGRQTVMPPSIHPEGMAYALSANASIVPAKELPLLTAADIARLEEALGAIGWSVGTDGAADPPRAVTGVQTTSSDDGGSICRETNDAALENLDAWVRDLSLPKLRRLANGAWEAVPSFRPSNTGTPLERRKANLKFHRTGIKDMGTDVGYTALDVIATVFNWDLSACFTWLRDKLGLADDDTSCIRLDVPRMMARNASGESQIGSPSPVTPPLFANDNADFVWDDREANASNCVQWLVKGLFPRVGVSLLWGQSGAGKSFVALDLAANVTSGEPFFGHRVKTAGGTLFALGEGAGSMPDRVNALRQGKFCGVAPAHPETDVPLDLDRLPIAWMAVGDLAKDGPFSAFVASVRRAHAEMPRCHGMPLRLVVIDTVVAAFGFPEDPDASTVTKAMRKLDALAQELGICIVAVHHAGKSKQAGEHGSYAWRGSAETSLEVDALRSESTGAVTERRLFVKKNRHGGNEGWGTAFDLKTVELGIDDDGDSITSCVVEAQCIARTEQAGSAGRLTTPGARRFMRALDPAFTSRSFTAQVAGESRTVVCMRDVRDEYLCQNSGERASVMRRFNRDLSEADAGHLVATSGDRDNKIIWPLDERSTADVAA